MSKKINPYIESYRIDDNRYDIEDYDDGQDPKIHFMAMYPHKRFRLWMNGAGLGQADTIEQARKNLFDLICRMEKDALTAYRKVVKVRERAIRKLGSTVSNLQKFRRKS